MDTHELANHWHVLENIPPHVRICSHPIFIIGSPRSGTTILAWSLAQHSQLWTSDESQILWDLFGDGRLDKNYQRAERLDGSWLRKQGIEKAEFLRFLGLGLNALFTSRSQGKRWIDQTPAYTLIADDLINMFPEAFFIHILRDGRAIVHSMINYLDRFRDLAQANTSKGVFPPWTVDFREACRTWNRYVKASLDFCARHPKRCLTVVNEKLVADPSQGFREILRFIHVPHEDSPADYFRSNRINSSFPTETLKPPGLPRAWEPWKAWNTEQQKTCLEEAGHTLCRTIACTVLPPGATVLVVSKGDEELLELGGRRAWHFPRGKGGTYAGYHPGASSEAIDHLEELRASGGEFLIFPSTAF